MHLLAATVLGFHVSDADAPHTALDWVVLAIGILGQAVFGGRFFLQWIHSERQKQSSIPESFWWLSVLGVLMTATYFMYRQEWVALLGNGPQLIPYTRNLILIHKSRPKKDSKSPVAAASVNP